MGDDLLMISEHLLVLEYSWDDLLVRIDPTDDFFMSKMNRPIRSLGINKHPQIQSIAHPNGGLRDQRMQRMACLESM